MSCSGIQKYWLIVCTMTLLSCQGKKFIDADDPVIAGAADHPGEWLTHGLNYSEDRYSLLDQVNTDNVARLGLAWTYSLGSKRGLEATPLVADGIMYFTGVWSVVYAVDARDGKLIWTYDPQVPPATAEKVCCDIVNRGVALYKGRIFAGTLDGRLIALDAAHGQLIWETATTDTSKPYSITGAPRVVDGKIIIGNGGAEFGVRGYFSAYDPDTGKQLWRFYTVPGDPSKPFENEAMKMAARTWSGNWWNYGGGGTAWDAMAYDPELKLLYVGTGNGSPWDRVYRSNGEGDNLFLSSILAINPDNGELVWYYQTTPGDSWDFTATQHIILTDLELNGRQRKVLMQAPKNGFFYVLDRTNGKLISADPFVYVNWARQVDTTTGRPVEQPGVHYATVNTDISPNYNGGHNWHPMAYNKKTGLVYIPARENVTHYGRDITWQYNKVGFGTGNGWNLAIGIDPTKPHQTDSNTKDFPRGMLIAWDPVSRKEAWRVPQTADWNGGVLTTAGNLLFQGTAQGDFICYDAKDGKIRWQMNLGGGILAPPVTYLVDGKQYISVLAGWGGGYGMKKKWAPIQPGRLFTFALDAKAPLPQMNPSQPLNMPASIVEAKPEELAQGTTLFWKYCGTCHIVNGGGGGLAPDLAYSVLLRNPEEFLKVTSGGAYASLGMPRFGGRLSDDELLNIRKYILSSSKP